MEKESDERFKEINQKFHKSYVKAKFFSGFIFPITILLNKIGYICLSMFGAIFILHGHLTIGGFLAFLLYGQILNGPLSQFSTALNQVQSGLSSLERIFEILDEKEEADESDLAKVDVDNVKGEIEFQNVEFGYVPEK